MAIWARLSTWNTPTESASGQHLVDLRLLVEPGQVHLDAVERPHVVDRGVQHGQHAEAEQVELDQPGRGAVVLVPLQDAAVGHAGPLHRAHLGDGPVTEHHAPGVDAEMPGEVLDLTGQAHHRIGDVVVGQGRGRRQRPPAVYLFGPGVELARARPQAPFPCPAPPSGAGR